MVIQTSADHSNSGRRPSMPVTTKVPRKVEGITIRERSNPTATSSLIKTLIKITVQNLEAGTYIKDISAWLSRAATRRRTLHRPEIETVIETMATMIVVENTGDEIGVDIK